MTLHPRHDPPHIPPLTPVRSGDPALTTILLLNAVRRGFARLAAQAEAVAEPDWSAYLAHLIGNGALPVETLVSVTRHPALPILGAALPGMDPAAILHDYGRAFAAELLAHEPTYLAHLHTAGVPDWTREALIARMRQEALLRDLEQLLYTG